MFSDLFKSTVLQCEAKSNALVVWTALPIVRHWCAKAGVAYSPSIRRRNSAKSGVESCGPGEASG
jgi:hypothetical protein